MISSSSSSVREYLNMNAAVNAMLNVTCWMDVASQLVSLYKGCMMKVVKSVVCMEEYTEKVL